MPVGKRCCGVHDHRIVVDEIYILYVCAFRQRMRRRHLQVLRQYGTQRFSRPQIAVGRQKDIRGTPAQGLIFIVGQQQLDMLLPASNDRRNGRRFCCLKRQGFFLVGHMDNDHSADQYRQQHQRDRDLEVAGNHGRPSIWLRICTIPKAMAAATLLCRFWLSSDWGSSSSGASSTAIAGAVMLFNGRNGMPRLVTVRPFFRSSSETARATVWLRLIAPDCALSQGRKRPASGCCGLVKSGA